MIRYVFGIISVLGIAMALGAVLARNLVHAALFLVAFFFLVACQFILLEAEFMAAVQVMVYIGAVAILILFGIMLTRNIQGDETTRSSTPLKVVAGVVSLGFLAVLIVGIGEDRGSPGRLAWSKNVVRPPTAAANDPNADARSRAINDMGRTVGREMMTRWVLPFEVAGLLLTAALVGAVALAINDRQEEAPRLGAIATTRSTGPEGPFAPAPNAASQAR